MAAIMRQTGELLFHSRLPKRHQALAVAVSLVWSENPPSAVPSPVWSGAERIAPEVAEVVAEVLAVAGAFGRVNPGRMRAAQTTIGPAKAGGANPAPITPVPGQKSHLASRPTSNSPKTQTKTVPPLSRNPLPARHGRDGGTAETGPMVSVGRENAQRRREPDAVSELVERVEWGSVEGNSKLPSRSLKTPSVRPAFILYHSSSAPRGLKTTHASQSCGLLFASSESTQPACRRELRICPRAVSKFRHANPQIHLPRSLKILPGTAHLYPSTFILRRTSCSLTTPPTPVTSLLSKSAAPPPRVVSELAHRAGAPRSPFVIWGHDQRTNSSFDPIITEEAVRNGHMAPSTVRWPSRSRRCTSGKHASIAHEPRP
jgi:hypothetical protein